VSTPDERAILTLHRYFIWANEVRTRFEQHLRDHGAPPAYEANLYPWMPYWYSALYVVVEGWQRLGLHDVEIDDLLVDEDMTRLLRRYRNGVFHFQETYHDERLTGLLLEGATSAQWVRDLHAAYDRWFVGHFDGPKPPGGSNV
jgi:hypothetical protein